MIGWREAQLDIVRILLIVSLNLNVIDDHQSLHSFLELIKFQQTTSGFLRLGRKPLDLGWSGSISAGEHLLKIFVFHLGRVVKVDGLGGSDDPILGGSLLGVEPIIAISVVVRERIGSIRKLMRLPDVLNVLMLGEIQPQLVSEHWRMIEILNCPGAGLWIRHFNHGASLLGLHEHDSVHVAVLAENVENSLTVHFLTVKAVDHTDARGSPPSHASHATTSTSP